MSSDMHTWGEWTFEPLTNVLHRKMKRCQRCQDLEEIPANHDWNERHAHQGVLQRYCVQCGYEDRETSERRPWEEQSFNVEESY